jgi:HK97 family phage portal protein
MPMKFYKLDGKSVTLWGDEGWTINNGATDNGLTALVREVPWLYRAVDLIGTKAASMPFALVSNKSGNDYDVTADWRNLVGYLPAPNRLIDQIARSLQVYGCAYVLKASNAAGRVKVLRYLSPTTITPILDARDGLTGFERNVGNGKVTYRPEDVIYFWPASESVELGPPGSSPVLAAANAAGVLRGADLFASGYMERGGVRVTILAVPETTQKSERDRLQSWWRNVVMGVKNAFAAHVMNADSVKPTAIGDGLEGLQNSTLTQSKREDIATALGVPQTLLWSNAANYATAQQDVLSFYDLTIVPLCEFIAEVLNEQLFAQQGLRMEIRPEVIDAFHADEKDMAVAYRTYISAGMLPSVAAQICGIELPAGMEYEDLDPEPEEEPEPTPPPDDEVTPPLPVEVIETMEREETPAEQEAKRWERKAARLLESGSIGEAADFVCYSLPDAEQARIRDGLKSCATVADVHALFAYDPIASMINALDRAAKAVTSG